MTSHPMVKRSGASRVRISIHVRYCTIWRLRTRLLFSNAKWFGGQFDDRKSVPYGGPISREGPLASL